MSIPDPAGLLVEHPAVPVPRVEGWAGPPQPVEAGTRTSSLNRRQRLVVAAQATAAVGLLSGFDLWPDGRGMRSLAVRPGPDGLSAVLGAWPRSLSRLIQGLGGGEGAMDRARATALGRIAAATRLGTAELQGPERELGLVADAAVRHQLRGIGRPLEAATARSLWALRWDGLPDPLEGIVQLWRVPLPDTAARLATALWCRLRRQHRRAWLRAADAAWADDPEAPALRGPGTLIVVGEIGHDELNALSRWVAGEGCSGVAVGGFPRGWRSQRPPLGSGQLGQHLSVIGMPPQVSRGLIEARDGRFEVLDAGDRAALTAEILELLAHRRRRAGGVQARRGELLGSWLGLSECGLPPGFIAVNSDLPPSMLQTEKALLGVVETNGWWRLPSPPVLEPDPRHRLVADLFAPGSGPRLLHDALGGGPREPLVAWARRRLDALDAVATREVLARVAPGVLGPEVELLHAEACLALLDLIAARAVLASLPSAFSAAHRRWCSALDPRPGTDADLPTADEAREQPRAAAEVAMLALVDAARRRRRAAQEQARRALADCWHGLSPELRARADIDIAYAELPEQLDDPGWRRGRTGACGALRVQLAHRRALLHLDRGELRWARRLLETLVREAFGPGLRGMFELDLGAVALVAGRTREAAGHHLRALHLLQSSGFEHLTGRPLFNLAVADVDQLRVGEAGRRLARLQAGDPEDVFVTGELARLALATGDEAGFRRLLSDFERRVDEGDPRFAEGLHLLRGAAAVLAGDPRRAMELLSHAGQEGEAWLDLAAAVAGSESTGAPADEWGVARAAELVRKGGLTTGGGEPWRLSEQASDALAVALAERVTGRRLDLAADRRSAAVRTLRGAGLHGWADHCEDLGGRPGALVTALGRVVEAGSLDCVESDQLTSVVNALGVSGLEVRDAAGERALWRLGGGAPGPELRHGRFVLVPLGGELAEGPLRHLVLGVLELVLPAAVRDWDEGKDVTGFLGVSDGARRVRQELLQLGPSHLPVLLLGETGVGKEVAARAIHRLSGRSGSFVPVNVAAIPASLLEAELFGSVKGAFTGADRSRVGLAAAADGGTLFLDEIGDLDPDLQVKLLRFIESGEVRSVGSHRAREVDVRIVSATHCELDRRMREGHFRRDLYFRIAAPEVVIPPLRTRTEDIPLLKGVFEREACTRHGLQPPSWSAEAEAALRAYHWPGNVRELRQVVEVALVRAGGGVVRTEQLPITPPESDPVGTWEAAQLDFRRRLLRAALRRHAGNRSAAARALGISRQALLYHLRKLGLQDLDDAD